MSERCCFLGVALTAGTAVGGNTGLCTGCLGGTRLSKVAGMRSPYCVNGYVLVKGVGLCSPAVGPEVVTAVGSLPACKLVAFLGGYGKTADNVDKLLVC